MSHDTIARGELALKRKHIIAAKAKENQGVRTDISQNSVKSVDTQKELAKIAGMSHDTIARGELALKRKHIIAAKAKENQQVRKGEQPGATCQNSDNLEGAHTRTREEAINAAGNVSGNVTVNVSCV